jgi:hypothetical protein
LHTSAVSSVQLLPEQAPLTTFWVPSQRRALPQFTTVRGRQSPSMQRPSTTSVPLQVSGEQKTPEFLSLQLPPWHSRHDPEHMGPFAPFDVGRHVPPWQVLHGPQSSPGQQFPITQLEPQTLVFGGN